MRDMYAPEWRWITPKSAMKFILTLFIIAAIFAGSACGQTLSITGPQQAELTEGKTYSLTWIAAGAETVSIAIRGTRTPLGAQSRGDFDIVVAKSLPAVQGEYKYALPRVDARKFYLKIKGYDLSGKNAASDSREYGFRPAVMASRLNDGIYLDLHRRIDQRLYVQRDQRITHVYLSSSSENYLWLPRNRHVDRPHDHAGVFRVLEKEPSHWSSLFHVEMPWAMRYIGGHFIHATSPRYYRLLGRAASHGCNRLTRRDARELYEMTPVGTRVEIIGPGG